MAETSDPFPALYDELRALAAARLAAEPSGHTLQPTALVHEVYLRLGGHDRAWTDRAHFLAAATRAMRHILVDHARRRGRVKRGGGARPVSLNGLDVGIAARAMTCSPWPKPWRDWRRRTPTRPGWSSCGRSAA